MKTIRVAALAVAFLFGLVGCGGAGQMAGSLKPSNGAPTAKAKGAFKTTIRLADLGLAARSRGGYVWSLDYELTNVTTQVSMASRVEFNSGEATINADLEVGTWRVHVLIHDGTGVALEGGQQFTVVANVTTVVDLKLARPTGSAVINVTSTNDFKVGDDLVSHDGKNLSRESAHRFTWTPIGSGGATSCRLYINLLTVSSDGTDNAYEPADVQVLNLDPASYQTRGGGGGQTLTRITAINAKPGVKVELSIQPTPWPGQNAADYNRLQFGRVNNGTPANYRVVGTMPVYTVGNGTSNGGGTNKVMTFDLANPTNVPVQYWSYVAGPNGQLLRNDLRVSASQPQGYSAGNAQVGGYDVTMTDRASGMPISVRPVMVSTGHVRLEISTAGMSGTVLVVHQADGGDPVYATYPLPRE